LASNTAARRSSAAAIVATSCSALLRFSSSSLVCRSTAASRRNFSRVVVLTFSKFAIRCSVARVILFSKSSIVYDFFGDSTSRRLRDDGLALAANIVERRSSAAAIVAASCSAFVYASSCSFDATTLAARDACSTCWPQRCCRSFRTAVRRSWASCWRRAISALDVAGSFSGSAVGRGADRADFAFSAATRCSVARAILLSKSAIELVFRGDSQSRCLSDAGMARVGELTRTSNATGAALVCILDEVTV
jgi:hypothetical protein